MKYFFLGFFICAFIFRQWFMPGFISAGDLWPITNKEIESIFLRPLAWNNVFREGLGGSTIPYLWNHFLFSVPLIILGKIFHLSWEYMVRLGYLFPFLFLSVYSSYSLSYRYMNKLLVWLSIIVYTANTYIIMLVSGGQMGIALGYAAAPFVLYGFFKNIRENTGEQNKFEIQMTNDKPNFWRSQISLCETKFKMLNIKHYIFAGLILSIQIMFDIRIAYITLLAVGLYFLLVRRERLFGIIIPIIIAVLLHFFWILPFVLAGRNSIAELGPAYSSSAMVKFLSFASFSNAISLLHPNWPENIFGKIYFQRAEFLLLPILAFSSLLFISKIKDQKSKLQLRTKNFKNNLTMQSSGARSCFAGQYNNKTILFFSLLALFGAFLAKGANPPFGGVYLWLFKNFPGFVMFRDPTKFYLLVVLSYTILIPYSLSKLGDWINEKLKIKNQKRQLIIKNLMILSFLVYWLFLIRPAWLGQLTGTFKAKKVPQEYVKLKDFIYEQTDFFRTFWLPQRQRFGFFSNNHPAIDSRDFLQVESSSGVATWLFQDEAEKQLTRWAVRYLIVPYDSEGEIFLEDRKYSEEKYREAVSALERLPYLRRINNQNFGKIAVYETVNPPFDHLFIESEENNLEKPSIHWTFVNPTKYKVSIAGIKEPINLVFSESYDSGWVLINGKGVIQSKKTDDGLNSFQIERTGDLDLTLFYQPQKYVQIGSIISLATLAIVLLILLKLRKRDKNE